jgi:hypothetical protein
MAEDTRKQTTVRIDEALMKAVRLADATGPERLSLTDAIDQGVRMLLDARRGGKAPQPKAQPSELEGLTRDDRALVLDLIAWLRDEPPGEKKRRNIVRGILTVFRG